MTITQIEERKDQQAAARQLLAKLNKAAAEAGQAQLHTVQLAWDLGDLLQVARENCPQTFDAFCEGAGVSLETVKQVSRIRGLADNRGDLAQPGLLRQALFTVLVPAKEGEERIELAPPQTWRKWVNASRIWARRVEIGLADYELEAFIRETDPIYDMLTNARRRAGKAGLVAEQGGHSTPLGGNPPVG